MTSFLGQYACCKVIINLSPLQRKINSLNEMQQISGHFVIYKPVLVNRYGDLIAWGSPQFRYSKGFLKYFWIYVGIFARFIARSRVIAHPQLWFNLSQKTHWALGREISVVSGTGPIKLILQYLLTSQFSINKVSIEWIRI